MLAARLLLRAPRRAPFRAIHSTPQATEAVPNVRAVLEENQDISSVDRLMRLVKSGANPAFNNPMPMRSPTLWSETLSNAAPKPDATNVPGQPPSDPSSPPRDPLVPRNLHDSYCELVLPFSSSSALVDQYINASGGIRMGKLMEHLDSLAGSIAYQHMLGPQIDHQSKVHDRGFYIVTASVDRLDMLAPIDPSRDIRISGLVIHAGRSSMEVAVKMENINSGKPDQTIMIGRFSMVCRDSTTHRARKVNPLKIATPAEQALHSLGEHLKERRQSLALKSLSRVPPSSEEAEELHSYFLRYGQDENKALEQSEPGVERVWMGDTLLEKCLLMFPQERNVHQKIFGGYLMRLAYELGFSNAALFTRGSIRFLSLDGISFARPVPIGCILRLRSQILHTTSSPQYPSLVHVGVQANVVDVKTGLEQTTNDFRFTWCKEGNVPGVRREVVPKTYKEAMLWLEGKRALEVGAEIRELRTTQ